MRAIINLNSEKMNKESGHFVTLVWTSYLFKFVVFILYE